MMERKAVSEWLMGILCGHWRASLDWRKNAAEDQRGTRREGREVICTARLGGRGLARGSGMYGTVLPYRMLSCVITSTYYYYLSFIILI